MGIELEVYGMTIDNQRKHITNGIYAHGELEKKCGYDLVWIPAFGDFPYKNDRIEDGIYDTVFIYPNGERVKAKTFVWRAREYYTTKHYGTETIIRHVHFEFKGLVVKDGDDEFMKDARKKWDKMYMFI